MSSPVISVLMPVYNTESFIAESIESILNQSFTDFELIICNDASTDSSKEIIEQYKDPRVRYFENEKNLGIVATRNKLFSLARGEFLAIMDADDISLPKRLEKQLKFLQKNPEYGVCGTWAKKIDNQSKTLGYIQMPVHNDDIKVNLLFQSSFVQSTVCLRKSALNDLQYDPNFIVAEDYDFWERLSHKTKMYNLPKYLALYRWHESNISKKKEESIQNNRRTIIKRQLVKLTSLTSLELIRHDQIGNLLPSKDEDFSIFSKNAQKWFDKLVHLNKEKKLYNQNTLISFIWYRWIFFCFYHKKYAQTLKIGNTRLNCRIVYHTLTLVCTKARSLLRHVNFHA